MSGDLLQTKLYVPRIRPSITPRPHLLQKLNDGLKGKLTLVSAPAGFGKTTLVTSWLRQLDRPAAWVSLDDGDNDLNRFLAYLLAALQMAAAEDGQTSTPFSISLTMLQSPQPPPATAVLSALINDLTRLPRRLVLALDDYHLVGETAVHHAITFLLDNMPPNLHLVITSRTIPPLPLPRLRARGQLREIDQQALRFAKAETTILLNDTLQLNLTPSQVATLETRTAGWIAGLQMAALSLQNQPDVAHFIDTFNGSHRYIFDYLMDEVLTQQPETMREFLRKTAVLTHLHADLCAALLEQDARSRLTLEQLASAHIFISPLDEHREWYRYHPLFADVLRQQLSADEQKTQHQRAAHWFAQQAMLPEAIDHALAAQTVDEAARLIQQAAHPTLMRGEHHTLQRWLDALPAALVKTRSDLALYQGWLHFIGGRIDQAATFAAAAQAGLPADAPSVQRGRLDCLRAWTALHLEGAETAVPLADSAIQQLGNVDKQFRILAGMVLGEAYDMLGDTSAAVSAYQDSVRLISIGDNTIFAQVALLHLAMGLNETGRRREAIALAQKHARPNGRSLLELVSGLADFETNELETAAAHIQAGLKVADQLNIGGMLLYGKHLLAQIQLAQGNWEIALQSSREVGDMGREQQSSFYINWAAAFAARIQLQHGGERVGAAMPHLPEKQPLPWEESTYFAATRRLLAEGKPDAALRLLTELETSARRGGRERVRLTILLRQAVAHQMQNEQAKAFALLQEALQLAAPEGYLTAFLDEGADLIRLLQEALTHLGETAVLTFAGQILAAAGAEPALQTALDPLTEREVEILRLIAAGRSNPEIGAHLFLSLNTVKWHLKNIYAKLHVRNRIEAAARAGELNLL